MAYTYVQLHHRFKTKQKRRVPMAKTFAEIDIKRPQRPQEAKPSRGGYRTVLRSLGPARPRWRRQRQHATSPMGSAMNSRPQRTSVTTAKSLSASNASPCTAWRGARSIIASLNRSQASKCQGRWYGMRISDRWPIRVSTHAVFCRLAPRRQYMTMWLIWVDRPKRGFVVRSVRFERN